MRHQLFVTGTDTDVGKTEIASAILHLARQKGLSTAALKPIAAGCEFMTDEQGNSEWKNADAIRLQQLCTIPLSYREVNPIALQQTMAPHLAAYAENKLITVDRLAGLTQNILQKKACLTVIEGAGGWRVPISHREMMSQYVQEMKFPVLLVAGIRLGCINHTLLTMEAIARDKLTCIGWIANCIDQDMHAVIENIQTLEHFLPVPCFGIIPFQQNISIEKVAEKFNFDLMIKQLESAGSIKQIQ